MCDEAKILTMFHGNISSLLLRELATDIVCMRVIYFVVKWWHLDVIRMPQTHNGVSFHVYHEAEDLTMFHVDISSLLLRELDTDIVCMRVVTLSWRQERVRVMGLT